MKQAGRPPGTMWLSRLWRPLPLVARVVFGATTALIVAGAALLVASEGKDADFARIQLEEELLDEMEFLLPAISEWTVVGDYATIEHLLRQRVKRVNINYMAWTNASGKTLEASDSEVALRAPGWFVRWVDIPAPRASRELSIGGHSYGQITIGMTATPSHNRLWAEFLGDLTVLVLGLALALACILFILTRGLRPLTALDQGTRALERGELSARIRLQGSPEFLRVIVAFNHMADAVTASQASLQNEVERLAVTLSSIGDGVIATDAESRVEFINPVAEALTGWTSADAKGHPVSEVFVVIREPTREPVDCPVGRAIREGVIVGLANHTLLVARDGTERPIADSAAPIRQVGGRVRGAVLVFRDQTEERRTLDRLTLAASVVENSLDAIVVTDPQQRIIEVNPAFTRITGYSRAEALGNTPRLLLSGRQDAGFYAAMWSAIEATGQWHGEIWNRHKDGKIFPEELSIVAVKDEDRKVIRYVGIFRDITQVKAQEAQLQHMAHYDLLTGLPNRVLLADRMKVALAQAERSREKLAVCYLDLDGFKPVNDTWGHSTGDRLLSIVAERLHDAVRGGDTAARMGGDEFVLLLANLTDMDECALALSRLLHAIAQPMIVDGKSLTVTASIGVTIFPDDGADADTLLRHADQALYAAKEAGRNRYHLFDPGHDLAARERRTSLAQLEAALAKGEFCLYYQPKVDMRAGTVIGAEALIRWQHPERGLLPPAEFLPLLEGSALEIRFGEWVIETALSQMDAWRDAGLNLQVAVNIAPPHLASSDFRDRLKELLDRHPDTTENQLELEVLESVALDDIEYVSGLIEACRRIGVAFALDDFGTGYSSLTYLKSLPAELIKIDQSFVRDMLADTDDLAIVEGVIGLAEAFHTNVIAEGVETVEQGLALIHLGCTLGQGYCIARPMPAQDMPGWIAGWHNDPSWVQASSAWSRNEAVLLGAELDHRVWIEELQAFVAEDTAGDRRLPTMDFHLCRFGRWYHGPGRLRYGGITEFQAIDPLHRKIHAIGDEIRILYEGGKHPEARQRMGELTKLHDDLVAQLHTLSKVITT